MKLGSGALLTVLNKQRKKMGIPRLDNLDSPAAMQHIFLYSQSSILKSCGKLGRQLSPNLKERYLAPWLLSNEFDALSIEWPFVDRGMDLLWGLDEAKVKRQELKEQSNARAHYGTEDIRMHDPSETLFTPYRILKQVARNLPQRGHVLDMGSGLGRALLVFHLVKPALTLTGIEIVRERVRQSQKLFRSLPKRKSIRCLYENLGSPNSKIPKADFYFLFNPFTRSTLGRVLAQLTSRSDLTTSELWVIRTGLVYSLLKRSRGFKESFRSATDSNWAGQGFSCFQFRSTIR
jgi:hypothetical protein